MVSNDHTPVRRAGKFRCAHPSRIDCLAQCPSDGEATGRRLQCVERSIINECWSPLDLLSSPVPGLPALVSFNGRRVQFQPARAGSYQGWYGRARRGL